MAPPDRNHPRNPEEESRCADRKSQLQDALRGIANAVQREDNTAAAKLLVEADESGLLPKRRGLATWLAKTFGRDEAKRLLNALAQLSCFGCDVGFTSCEACEGHGLSEQRGVCDQCLGLGLTPCDFCGGSGWISVDVVPTSLRPIVVAERGELAVNRARGLVRRSLPAVSDASTAECSKVSARLLLALERERAVMENTLMAAKELTRRDPRIAKTLRKTCLSCAALEAAIEPRLRECLETLAQCARLEAMAAEKGSSEGQAAESRAAFYGSLSASRDFTGSILKRARLQRAAKKYVKERPTVKE